MRKVILALLCLAAPAWADIAVTPGSGKTIQSDTVNSKEIQFVKIVEGEHTSSNTITGSPLGLRVDLSSTGVNVNALKVSQSGVFQVEPGTNVFRVDGSAVTQPVSGTLSVNTHAVTQSGVFQVEPGTNTFKVGVGNFPASQAITGNVGQSGAWSVSPGTGVFRVDGSAVTQPVSISGTVNVSGGSGGGIIQQLQAGTTVSIGYGNVITSVPVSIQNATLAVTQSGNFNLNNSTVGVVNGGTALNVTVNAALPTGTNNVGTVTGSTVTIVTPQGTKLLVTPDSVALPANQSINNNQVGGVAIALGGAGEQRVSCEVSGTSNTVQIAGTVNVSGSSGGGIIQQLQGGTTVSIGYGNVITSVPVNIQNASLATTQSGAWSVSPGTGVVRVDGSAVTQPVSGTLSVNTHAVTESGAWQINNSTVAVHGYLADNTAAAGANRVGTISGIYESTYNGGTAGVVGRDATISIGTDGMQRVAVLPAITEKSFSASTNTITVAATATDITALCGNASNMVLVYGLRVSCTETTAGSVNLSVFKRSTKFTGAWSTMTAVAQDSTYAVTNSSAVWFTANPVTGTLAGHLDNYKLGCMATATASPNDIYISPASWRMKPIVLRGAAECIAVNLESQTVTGGAFTVGYEWIETTTITP